MPNDDTSLKTSNIIPVLKKGIITEIPDDPDKVRYEFVSPTQFFGNTLNLLPMQNSVAAARAFYEHKFYTQALPLTKGEAPYVQSLKDGDESFEEYLGRKTGVITLDPDEDSADILDVTPDYIKYKNNKGEVKSKSLYNNFAFNRKTFLNNIPLVKKGDKITRDKNSKSSPVLARTNYTDNNGTLNMGLNARVGFVPYKGWSMDDAVVISQSFADKLRSNHMYQYEEDDDTASATGKNYFNSVYPGKYSKEQLDKIDDNGVVKVGSIVNENDPIILSTKPRTVTYSDANVGKLSKYLKSSKIDATQKWDHPNPGIVRDVVKTKDGYKVNIETESGAIEGDKMASRSGNKLTISHIIPDEEMPRTKDGKPLDVLFNQLGLVSRVNANMIYETLLGKVAEKTGKRYKLPTFNKGDEKWFDYVEKELKDNNLTDVEPVYDPVLGRDLDNPITVGNVYFLKLHHMVDSKLSQRGQGAYDNNDEPLKGGDEMAKAKRMSGLETAALLSSGAYNVLKDSTHVRGQKNDDFWRKVRLGQTPQLINKSPFVWDKFLALMQGAGINTKRADNGESIQATPFTDKDFDQFNPIEIKNDNIMDFKTMKPLDGGFFSPELTVANKWGKITLDKHYPNPAFENVIISLLGIKKSQFDDIIKGDLSLQKYGTGTEALYNALKDINVDLALDQAKKEFKSGPKSKKQQALNRIMALDGLKRNKMRPEEYMISKVPVLPPKFRPFALMGDTFLPGDANELYQDVFNVVHTQNDIREELGDDEANKNSINVYNSLKALYGYGEPTNQKLKQRGVSGFLRKLIGGTSKFSQFNRSVVSKPVDFTGRSVIDANPDLSMDEMGIPYKMGLKIYSPYIHSELVKRGYSNKDALENIEKGTELAKSILRKIGENRYIISSRAPAWHKPSVLGFKPIFHDGKNILLPPVVASGLGADYDGDMQVGYIYVAIKKNID